MADHEMIHGGPHVPWEQSIRGKLHLLMGERAARRHERREHSRRFSRGETLCLLAFGLVQTMLMCGTFYLALTHG